MMKWFPLLASLLASPSYSAGPFARASVNATDGIVPGQQLRVIVEVFAPDFMQSSVDVAGCRCSDRSSQLPQSVSSRLRSSDGKRMEQQV